MKKTLVFFTVLTFKIIFVTGADQRRYKFPIGGLFDEKSLASSRQTFQVIQEGKTEYYGRTIESRVADSYSPALDVCNATSAGIVALVDGRPGEGICDAACLLCNRYQINYLTTSAVPSDTLDDELFTFSYYPSPEMISKAYATLIRQVLQWDKFTILYEDSSSFLRLQEIIDTWPHDQHPIMYRKLNPDEDNLETFKEIFKVAHMTFHVLDCDVQNVKSYMKEIMRVENSTQYQSFLLTNLDSYKLDFRDMTNLLANVSTLHFTKLHDKKWNDLNMPMDMELETALISDALTHLENSIRYMLTNRTNYENFGEIPNLCYRSRSEEYAMNAWAPGEELRQALLKTRSQGFTGNIEFDEKGRRTNVMVLYSKLNSDGEFVHAGIWDQKTDNVTTVDSVTDRSSSWQTRSILKIVSRKGKPYLDIDENGNYTGYAVDLIQAIFDHIRKTNKTDFRYEFYRVSDDKLGNPIEGTKKWDGIIGELIEHNADLGVSDITITSDRNNVVDFSTPFMSLGISMLFREQEPESPNMFTFMEPLDLDVWLYLASMYIVISFVLLICARMSQGDWVNPHPCNQNPENLENIWTLYNCLWLTMGSIMTQGCDILPRAGGSRWITGMWWFFTLIVTASYTANISTFVSNSRRSREITDIAGLSEQNDVSYGAMLNGSTYKFFETTDDPVLAKIWSVMSSARPTVFTTDNEEGRNRVLRSKGKYVFFMESTAIEYYTNRYCELKMVGPKLDSKEYGIAMPKNFRYRSLIDSAILTLQEKTVLDNLKSTWWKTPDDKCHTTNKAEEDEGGLQMKNTSGIFLMLSIGGILGLIVSVIDFLLHAHRIRVKERLTFREAVISEWRSSLNPRTIHKPVAPPRSVAPSVEKSPVRERSQSRAASVLRAATSFINLEDIY